MSHVKVAQGGSNTHYALFYEHQGGSLVDDDRYVIDGTLPETTIVTPAGASGVTVAATAVRVSKGYYGALITASVNATESTVAVSSWKVRYTLQINGTLRSFEYEFLVTESGAGSEAPVHYNHIDAYRRAIAEEIVIISDVAVGAAESVELGKHAVKVISVEKNSIPLTVDTDYSFKPPGKLILVDEMTDDDVLKVRIATHFEDTEIEVIATEVRNRMDSKLIEVYALPFTEVPQKIKTIEREWVRGRLMLEAGPRPQFSLTEEDRKMAFAWINAAKKELEGVVQGRIPLLLSDNTVIPMQISPADFHLDIQIDAIE